MQPEWISSKMSINCWLNPSFKSNLCHSRIHINTSWENLKCHIPQREQPSHKGNGPVQSQSQVCQSSSPPLRNPVDSYQPPSEYVAQYGRSWALSKPILRWTERHVEHWAFWKTQCPQIPETSLVQPKWALTHRWTRSSAHLEGRNVLVGTEPCHIIRSGSQALPFLVRTSGRGTRKRKGEERVIVSTGWGRAALSVDVDKNKRRGRAFAEEGTGPSFSFNLS